VNIAHVHVRFARLASERDGQLGTTVTLTRREPARLIFDVLRHRESDTCRTVAAKGGTAHLLFGIAIVRVERSGRTPRRERSVPSNGGQIRPPKIRVKQFQISSMGDTTYPA